MWAFPQTNTILVCVFSSICNCRFLSLSIGRSMSCVYASMMISAACSYERTNQNSSHISTDSVCEFSRYMYKIHTCILTYQRYSLYISRAVDFVWMNSIARPVSTHTIHTCMCVNIYITIFDLISYHIVCGSCSYERPNDFTYTRFANTCSQHDDD